MPFNVALTILKCGLYILILNIIHIILITVITLGQMQKNKLAFDRYFLLLTLSIFANSYGVT